MSLRTINEGCKHSSLTIIVNIDIIWIYSSQDLKLDGYQASWHTIITIINNITIIIIIIIIDIICIYSSQDLKLGWLSSKLAHLPATLWHSLPTNLFFENKRKFSTRSLKKSVPTILKEFKTTNKIQELKLKTCNAVLILVVPTKVARSISNEFFRAFCCSSFETLIACELLGVSAQICKSAFCKLMENIWRPHCFSNLLASKSSSFVISCWIYLNIFVKFQFAAGIMLPRNTERI